MGDRLKVFGIVALLGFMAGVIAQLTAEFIIPWMISVLPMLGGLTSYMVSGFAGALLTIGLVSVWAYLTGNRNRP
jgi:zinc transporter ZupT